MDLSPDTGNSPETQAPSIKRTRAGARDLRPQKHPRPRKERTVPYGIALTIVAPTELEQEGHRALLRRVYAGRCALDTVRNWANGRRPVPDWARSVLAEEARRKIAALQHALDLLEGR